jgi:hypothetical protein
MMLAGGLPMSPLAATHAEQGLVDRGRRQGSGRQRVVRLEDPTHQSPGLHSEAA